MFTASCRLMPASRAIVSKLALLLHLDGANNSTTFTDVRGATITGVGSPHISTANFKYGGSSLQLDGTSSYLVTPVSAAYGLGTGDFTIEGSFNATDLGRNSQCFLDTRSAGASTQVKPTIFVQSNQILFYSNGVQRAAASVSANTWYTVAWSRVSGTSYFFLNGTLIASVADTFDYGSSNDILIGQVGDSRTSPYYFGGYIDEVRVTKGLGRYTASYTVATSEFPDS